MYTFEPNTAIVEQFEETIVKEYKNLMKEYNSFKSGVEELYNVSVDEVEHKDKLINKVNTFMIDKNNYEVITEYELKKEESVLKLLKKHYNYDNEKLQRIFDVRIRSLSKKKKNLDVNKIGTALNILNDFHHDVYIDVKRNKLNWESNPSLIKLGSFKVDIEPRNNNQLESNLEIDY